MEVTITISDATAKVLVAYYRKRNEIAVDKPTGKTASEIYAELAEKNINDMLIVEANRYHSLIAVEDSVKLANFSDAYKEPEKEI